MKSQICIYIYNSGCFHKDVPSGLRSKIKCLEIKCFMRQIIITRFGFRETLLASHMVEHYNLFRTLFEKNVLYNDILS